jgi:transcriptional regulator with XRE-family HTH domain
MSESTAITPATPDYNEVVAANVRAELARAGRTQTQLAQELQVSQMWVSRRLSGSTPCDPNDVALFARHFKIPVADLFNFRPKDYKHGGSVIPITSRTPKPRPVPTASRPLAFLPAS